MFANTTTEKIVVVLLLRNVDIVTGSRNEVIVLGILPPADVAVRGVRQNHLQRSSTG